MNIEETYFKKKIDFVNILNINDALKIKLTVEERR